jgi:integrase
LQYGDSHHVQTKFLSDLWYGLINTSQDERLPHEKKLLDLELQFLEEGADDGYALNTILLFRQTFKHLNKSGITIEDFNSAGVMARFAAKLPGRWANNTISGHLRRLQRFGNWLALNHITHCKHRTPEQQRRPKRREVMLEHEVTALLESLQQRGKDASKFKRAAYERDHLVTRVLYETGARISETLDLCVDDVIANEHGNYLLIRGTKSDAAERVVEISAELFIRLAKFRQEQGIARGRIFRTRTGKAVDRVGFNHFLKRYCQQLEIHCNVTPHLFRYMYIIREISKGTSALEVMTRLGHAGVNQTVYYYNQVRRLMPWVETNKDVALLEKKINYWRKRAKKEQGR